MKTISVIFVCSILVVAYVPPALAGGKYEAFDITGMEPSPIEGQVIARPVSAKWDTRCIPVQFYMNDTLDPIPNPLGEDFLSLAEATEAMQQSVDAWNDIPTSFIDMQITGTTSNPGLAGFDTINEVTFRSALGSNFIASAVTRIFLIEDLFLSAGTDIDGDGDSDVSSDITTCQDADGDGDIEFPEGFYEAGTLFDQDVEFNTQDDIGKRFTVNPTDIDNDIDSKDLIAIAVHEFGHAHGLGHTLINQVNPTSGDGTAATMFIPVSTFDFDSDEELNQRTLETDDIAYSSFFYPEGSATEGPAALQEGDVPFDEVFGFIEGELFHGVLEQPIAGGSIFAINTDTGEIVSSAISGTTQLSFDPETGTLPFINDPSIAILDGKYVLPVPAGTYKIGVEAVDGSPMEAVNVNNTTQVGNSFPGLLDFDEEFFDAEESDLEVSPGSASEITVQAGQTIEGIDIITNRTIKINNFGELDSPGSRDAIPGRFYAVRIPAEQIADVNPGGDILIQAATFFTSVVATSVVPVFAEAMLTTGVLNPDGTVSIDLDNPLERVTDFIGQDTDFSPLYFDDPKGLGQTVREGIEGGEIENLFLVLRVPTEIPFPGPGGFPPVIGLDGFVGESEDNDDTPPFGLSFVSEDDGATFVPISEFLADQGLTGDLDFMFGLILSEAPPDSGSGGGGCAIAGRPVHVGTAVINILILLIPASAVGYRILRRKKLSR